MLAYRKEKGAVKVKQMQVICLFPSCMENAGDNVLPVPSPELGSWRSVGVSQKEVFLTFVFLTCTLIQACKSLGSVLAPCNRGKRVSLNVFGSFPSMIFFFLLKLVDFSLLSFFRAGAVHLAGADFPHQVLLPAGRQVWQVTGSSGLLGQ